MTAGLAVRWNVGLTGGRVEVSERLDDAIDHAVADAQAGSSLGGAGVIVTGSIVTVGEARHLLRGTSPR